MYKMVVEILRNKWKSCRIKAIYYSYKEKNMSELWLKINVIEIQLGHSNIADVVVKRIRKYLGKKTAHYKRRKGTIQMLF